MTTVEDIERQQKIRRILLRTILLILLIGICILIAWLISIVGYREIPDHTLNLPDIPSDGFTLRTRT